MVSLLETTPNQVKDRKLIWNIQYGYANKLCLNKFVVFSDEEIGLASGRKALSIVDFILSRACDSEWEMNWINGSQCEQPAPSLLGSERLGQISFRGLFQAK